MHGAHHLEASGYRYPDPVYHITCFESGLGCGVVVTSACADRAVAYVAVRKKPDAAEREGMPMTVSKLCYETQLIARPKDPSEQTDWVLHWAV
jgi:hypothetical protein